MVEKTIFVTKVDDLKYVTSKYNRVYFGNEFCQKLLPTRNELEKTLRYCNKNKLKFSLVTPYVTDEGLNNIERLFLFLNDMILDCEVIINDWGVLDLLNKKYRRLQPVLGRLLTKQHRDPRIVKLTNYKPAYPTSTKASNKYIPSISKILPDTLISYYKELNINLPLVQNFLVEQRINRVDLDNIFQGIELRIVKDNLSASLYIPYGYIATTRLCSASPFQKRKKFYCRISFCKKKCQKYTLGIKNSNIPKIVYKKGNTIFFKNSEVPAQRHLKEKRINRLVYQAEIPL